MLAGLRPSSDSNDHRTTSGRRDRGSSREPSHPNRGSGGPARSPGPPRARRLVDQRRPGRREVGRSERPATLPTTLPPRSRPRRSTSGRCGGRRARVRQFQARDAVAARAPWPRSSKPAGGLRHSDLGHGERVQVEFVSANPTGPDPRRQRLVGAYGDALARVLSRCGWDVQPRVLRERHRRPDPPPRGEPAGPAPWRRGARGGLPGRVRHRPGRRVRRSRRHRRGRPVRGGPILENIRATLDRSASSSTSGTRRPRSRRAAQVDETIAIFRERASSTRQDGAIWFRATELGDSRDRVLVRSNGDATYLAGDLAYHRDKFLVRRFDRVIDIFGADHHGQVASLMAGVAALGVDARQARDQARPARQPRRRAACPSGPGTSSSSTRSSTRSDPTRPGCCRFSTRSTRPRRSTSTS